QPTYVAITNNHFTTYRPSTGAYTNKHCSPTGLTRYGVPFANRGAGNYACGNFWDDGAFPGSGSDQSNTYPTAVQPIVACATPAPWVVPNEGVTTTVAPTTVPPTTATTVTPAPTTTTV